MGFFTSLKKAGKTAYKSYKEKVEDERKYKKEVASAVKIAQRDAYKKEAVKQAMLKAKIKAKQNYNPSPQQSSFGGGMSADARALIYGSSSTPAKQQELKRKYIKKPKANPKDAVADLLRKLPE